VSDRVFQTLTRAESDAKRTTMEVDELMLFASRVQPLSQLSEHVRRTLCELATSRSVDAGEVVCRLGEHADAFYVILSGSIQVYLDAEDGEVVVVATRYAGEGFGHAALTEDICAQLRQANCRAMSPTTMMCITNQMYVTAQDEEAERMWEEEMKAQISRSEIKLQECRGEAPVRRKSQLLLAADPNVAHVKQKHEQAHPGHDLVSSLSRQLAAPGVLNFVITGLLKPRGKRSEAERAKIIQVARTTRFFLSLDVNDCEHLADRMRYLSAHPNQILMQTGDDGDMFYIVLNGELQVESKGTVLTKKRAGECFGEAALISHDKRTADVIALTQCDFATLSRADYLEVVQAKARAKREKKTSVIDSSQVFGRLSSVVRDAIAECMRSQTFNRGDVIIQQDSPSEDLFLLARGTCDVLRTITQSSGSSAKKITMHINTVHRGETFGELGVIKGVPRSATVIAVHSTEVLAMSRIELARLSSVCPELRDNLGKAFYPSDEEILQTWKYDAAWSAYRRKLYNTLAMSNKAHWSNGRRIQSAHEIVLPAFNSQRYEPALDTRSRQLTSSQMFPWADEYLEMKVLPNLADLIVEQPEPEPYVPLQTSERCSHQAAPPDTGGGT